jgi:histidinol-phosphate/aromatic aminotransferase/cobyric acid decarboxylase-like protein
MGWRQIRRSCEDEIAFSNKIAKTNKTNKTPHFPQETRNFPQTGQQKSQLHFLLLKISSKSPQNLLKEARRDFSKGRKRGHFGPKWVRFTTRKSAPNRILLSQ